MKKEPIPTYFYWRRLHSLSGIFLVLFIIFHLLTNSLAALPIGNDGLNFINSVNNIHNTPFLLIVEILILAIPILIHMIWGIKILRTGQSNAYKNDGINPYFPENPQNVRYTWQRITSWMLLIFIVAHVVDMRILDSPVMSEIDGKASYRVEVTLDEGLHSLAKRLHVDLLTEKEDSSIAEGEIIAVASNFGTAELLLVRDTFKNPVMLVLYTIFVLAACFHAFNGLWTAMITWGVTLTKKSQDLMWKFCCCLMIVVTFSGLSAIWLTYFVNLKS